MLPAVAGPPRVRTKILSIFTRRHGVLPCLAVLASRTCDVGQVGYEMALLVERVGQALTPAARQSVSRAG